MKQLKPIVWGVLGCFALVGCQSSNPNNATPTIAVAPTPKPAPEVKPTVVSIDGKWVPTDPANRKVYYNEFRKGKFAAYTVDGQNTLAIGSYSRTANGVRFKYFSKSRDKNVTADCQLFGTNRLQCSVDGSIVDLQRA